MAPDPFAVLGDTIEAWEPVELGCDDYTPQGPGSPDPNYGCRAIGVSLTSSGVATTLLAGDTAHLGNVELSLLGARFCCEVGNVDETCPGFQYVAFAS